MTTAIFPRASRRRWRSPAMREFRARQKRGAQQTAAISASASAIMSRAPGSGRSKGVTVRVLPERQGRSRNRGHQPGAGHAHDLGADRRRSGRLRHRRHRHDGRRYRGDQPRRRRLRQPPGGQCRLLGADRRQIGARPDRRRRGAHARRRRRRDRPGRRPRRRALGQPPVDRLRRSGALGAGHAGLLAWRPARRRGSSTPPISPRRRPPIATARMWPRSRSIPRPAR